MVPVAPSMPSQNVSLEVTITDTLGTAAPAVKNVSMLVAEDRMGRIRSANAMSQGTHNVFMLNVDARPDILADGRILLDLTIEYVPDARANPDEPSRAVNINESLTMIVPDGNATLISRSADPTTDRRVTVEVTATVVK